MSVSWFGWGAVSSSRPADARAARAAAVKDGRRPPPEAARSVLDGGEHDATLKAGPGKNHRQALFRLTIEVRGPCTNSAAFSARRQHAMPSGTVSYVATRDCRETPS